MTARLLQNFFLILIFIIPHTVLYTQNEDPFKNVGNDDLSSETVGSGAGEKKSRFGKITGSVTDEETGQPLIGTNIVVVGKV